jgi:hypothetical protein
MAYKPSRELRLAIETAIQNIASTGGAVEWWKKFWALIGMMMGEVQGEVVRGLEPSLAIEGELAVVEGREMHGTLKDHEHACITQITKEQRASDVNAPLIALLSNSALLARQCSDMRDRLAQKTSTATILARLRGILDRLENNQQAIPAVSDLIRLLTKDEGDSNG